MLRSGIIIYSLVKALGALLGGFISTGVMNSEIAQHRFNGTRLLTVVLREKLLLGMIIGFIRRRLSAMTLVADLRNFFHAVPGFFGSRVFFAKALHPDCVQGSDIRFV